MGSNVGHIFAAAFFQQSHGREHGSKTSCSPGRRVQCLSAQSGVLALRLLLLCNKGCERSESCCEGEVVDLLDETCGVGWKCGKCGCDIGLRLLVRVKLLVRGIAAHAAVSSRRARTQATFSHWDRSQSSIGDGCTCTCVSTAPAVADGGQLISTWD